MAQRAIGRGLAKVEPASPNTLIAYSAKAGSTAQDGDGKNSPFTIALSQHLTTPGLDVRRAFGFVRDDVLKATANRQEPYRLWLARRRRRAAGAGAAAAAAAVAPAAAAPNPQADIRRDYELALQVGNRSAFNAFLTQHPDGFYSSLAKLQLDKIAADDAHAAAVEKAKQAEQERVRLAAAGAQKDAQAKADADAKAAEQARLDAEKAQQAAQQQAADAERNRVAAASLRCAAPAAPAPDKNVNVAALNPPRRRRPTSPSRCRASCAASAATAADADGDWDATSQRSLSAVQPQRRHQARRQDRQCRYARCDQAEAVAGLPAGLRARLQGRRRHCVKIVCAEGSFLNDDNECEKRRDKKPVAKRDESRSQGRLATHGRRREAGRRRTDGRRRLWRCRRRPCAAVARCRHRVAWPAAHRAASASRVATATAPSCRACARSHLGHRRRR